VIVLGSEFLARFDQHAERTVYLTDGCAEVSRSPDLYLNHIAREIAPARMTGNYGGEILRGIRAFKPVRPSAGVFSQGLMDSVAVAAGTYAEVSSGHPVSFAAFRQLPWHHYGLLALEETQLSLRSPFLDNDFVRTVFRAPHGASAGDHLSRELIGEGNAALATIPTDRGPAAAHAGAAATRAWVDFVRKAEYAFDAGMPQWYAAVDRRLRALRLERLFLGHQKFSHFRLWYRGALSRYVKEMLLDTRTLTRPHVDAARVEGVVQDHVSGRRNHTFEIHKLLTLELIHRLFIDPGRVTPDRSANAGA
jgi:asparagine synthase (glutamine-hydrolysing)